MNMAMTFQTKRKRNFQDRARSIFIGAYVNSAIGFQLQKYRTRSGVSIDQAADAIKQTPTKIRQMEAGVGGAPLCDISKLVDLYNVRSMRFMRFFTALSFEISKLSGRLPQANAQYRILKARPNIAWFIFMSIPMLVLDGLWNLQKQVVSFGSYFLALIGSLTWFIAAGALFLALLMITPLILTLKFMARGFRAVHAML